MKGRAKRAPGPSERNNTSSENLEKGVPLGASSVSAKENKKKSKKKRTHKIICNTKTVGQKFQKKAED